MANVVGSDLDDTLNGTSTDDQISGLAGSDKLNGEAGNDQLFGDAGADTLNGGAGADTMFGGAGADTYDVDDVADLLSEQNGAGLDEGGKDRVRSTVSFTLPAFIERLTLLGTAAIVAMGNDLANALDGNGAANILTGNGGKDMLTGGAGADIFMFGAADATSTDEITDFAADDWIGIKASDYGLSEGFGLVDDGTGKLVLDASYFTEVSGSTNVQGTSTGHGQFVYNNSTQTLLWDADGAGTASSGVALDDVQFGRPKHLECR